MVGAAPGTWEQLLPTSSSHPPAARGHSLQGGLDVSVTQRNLLRNFPAVCLHRALSLQGLWVPQGEGGWRRGLSSGAFLEG